MFTKEYPEFENLVKFVKQKDEVMALYLIGSYGTSYYGLLSDLDFAVLTKNPLDISEQLSLQSAFSSVLENDEIDLVFLDQASLELQHKLLSEGRLLFNRDPIFLADFVERTIKWYCDFAIDLRQFYRDYDDALRKEFLHD